ncbi:MAG TPA: hypothetical protein G4O19_04425 [Dehalococcoidia bacterium]|nr:hypothetical protein [Dehalococcoidia bacterium]
MAIQLKRITSKDVTESRRQIDKVYEEYQNRRLSIMEYYKEVYDKIQKQAGAAKDNLK